jgi:protein TonB
MRGSVIGSSVVHVVLLVVVLAVRAASPIVIPGPDVVQVSLVDAPTMAMAMPPAPPPKPEVPADPIEPTAEEGVKLEPAKPKKPEKQPEKVPDPPERPPAPALPYAAAGSSGLQGQISLDVVDFEFTYYLIQVRNEVIGNWTPPSGMEHAANRPVAVYFRIARNGVLSEIRLVQPSGIEFYDRSTVRAVTLSNPLPPLPMGYRGSTLGVRFEFEYVGQ